MRITRHTVDDRIVGYRMTLSANDTYRWATRPEKRWPGSQLSDHRCAVTIDRNGLCDMTIDGRDGDCDGTELEAIVADHLPADCRHLWPVWDFTTR